MSNTSRNDSLNKLTFQMQSLYPVLLVGALLVGILTSTSVVVKEDCQSLSGTMLGSLFYVALPAVGLLALVSAVAVLFLLSMSYLSRIGQILVNFGFSTSVAFLMLFAFGEVIRLLLTIEQQTRKE